LQLLCGARNTGQKDEQKTEKQALFHCGFSPWTAFACTGVETEWGELRRCEQALNVLASNGPTVLKTGFL